MILDGGSVKLEIIKGDGEVLEMLATYRRGSPAPPRHYHPEQEERFTVRSGGMWYEVDGVERVVGAGESLVVAPGTMHQARNASRDEDAVVTWEVRPALRTREFFAALFAALRTRSVLARIAVLREFRREFVLASPPRLVQTCVFGLLAPLARALGKAPF